MKDGDVYKWYYKNDSEYRRTNPGTAYWCKDSKAVVINGCLVDTYWSGPNNNFISSTDYVLDESRVDLEFICNINDVEFIKEYKVPEYDTVFNLSYQKGCYKLFAIPKGAQVSPRAQLENWKYKLEKALSAKRCAEWDIEEALKNISELENLIK